MIPGRGTPLPQAPRFPSSICVAVWAYGCNLSSPAWADLQERLTVPRFLSPSPNLLVFRKGGRKEDIYIFTYKEFIYISIDMQGVPKMYTSVTADKNFESEI